MNVQIVGTSLMILDAQSVDEVHLSGISYPDNFWRPTMRRAFTLIEILVALFVISVLIGMLVIGVRYSINHANTRATKITMESLKSIAAEYPKEIPFQRFIFEPEIPKGVPGPVYEGSPFREGVAVVNTAEYWNTIMAVPAAREMIANLKSIPVAATQPTTRPSVVPVDAWGNPIIMVPSAVVGVKSGGKQVTVWAPTSQPYFMSAGPDGRFDTGDDNVYSWE